jgi:type IV pilus assembly protein PilO
VALNKRERGLLIVTGCAVFATINYLWLVPQMRSWDDVQQTLQQRKAQVALMERALENFPQWQAEYAALRQQVRETSDVPASSTEVLKKIEDIAAISGVVVSNRRPRAPIERDVYREFPVDCKVEATIESLTKFLFALQTSSGFMNVEQLSVTPSAGAQGVLNADIVIRALAGKSERTAT